MSKAGRKKKHSAKMKERRKRKAEKRALYASYAGTSKRAKKVRRKSPISGIHKHEHLMSDCGNPGCKRCYPAVGGG